VIFSAISPKEGKAFLQNMAGSRINARYLASLCVLTVSLWGCGGSSSTPHVLPPTLTSIAISTTNSTVALGASQPFKATAAYSDNSTADVTSSTSWSSSDTSKATIQTVGQLSPGLSKGIALGSAMITASLGGKTATTTLAINSLRQWQSARQIR
jgi:hypothetical protein